MRFFRDSDQLTEVEWYFVPEGTPYVPFRHKFLSSVWCSDPGPPDGVGEVPYDMQWVNGAGAPPGQTGRVCGERDWWQNGVPSEEMNVPIDTAGRIACCTAPIPPGGLPAGAGVWLAGADLAAFPDFASIPSWPNRADPANPAVQANAGRQPAVMHDFPGLLPCASFAGRQGLSLRRAVRANSFSLYAVWFSPNTAGPVVVGSNEAFRFLLVQGFSFPLSVSFVALSLGTVPGSLFVNVPLVVCTNPLVARVDSDATHITLTTFGDIAGTATRADVHPGRGLKSVGNDPGEPLAHGYRLAEILWYPRRLEPFEDIAVMDYLASLYIP